MRTGTLISFLTVGLLMAGPVSAKVLGTVGQVFPIAERDALEEIEERAGVVDWQSILARETPETFRPPHPVRLPRARENRVFLVDMRYTLEFDVPDGRGGILYPKGFRFNPLDHVPFNQTLVVLDGDDPGQRAWLKESPLADGAETLILLSGGAYREVGKELGRAVFYLDQRLVDRFRLVAAPSVVTRKGSMMEVREIELPRSAAVAR